MEDVIVEVASVSKSGVMNLPKRTREGLGMTGPGRVVIFVNPKTKRGTIVFEAACVSPLGAPRV